MTALLEVRNLTKIYGHITANKDVNLKLQAGEIHCVLGENGAGKSTLMRCIYGAERVQQGEIYWQGARTELTSSKHARSLGIGMVFQNFSLINELTVADNLQLYLSVWNQDTTSRINALASQLELKVDLSQTVGELSAGQKQHVELLRVLLDEPQLVILDEPTSMLTAKESHALQLLLKDLSARDIAILLITHKLDEALNLADNMTILRRGRSVATLPNQALSKSRLGALLVGEMGTLHHPTSTAMENKAPLLVCERLSHAGRPALVQVSLSVRPGEIVGIGGIAGNGQETLNRLLIQARRGSAPAELLLDRDCVVGFTPEDRDKQGCAPKLTLMDNLLIGHPDDKAWISRSRLKQECQSVIDQFDVVSATPESVAESLSGGNLQKFLLGRILSQQPDLLICNNPTWGIDIKAQLFIQQLLLEARAAGRGILLITQDVEELLLLSDRAGILCDGYLSPLISPDQLTPELLGIWMSDRTFPMPATADFSNGTKSASQS